MTSSISSTTPARVIEQSEWAEQPGKWRGDLQLGPFGGNLCLLFNLMEPGRGPRLHRHPYAETFIIRSGRALFTVGEETLEAVAGQIVVVPAGVAHKFVNAGPDILDTLDIHENGHFVTEWLE